MCGIVGFCGKENAVPFLIKGLKRLEYRGYDSAGIALLDESGFDITKTTKRIDSLEEQCTDFFGLTGIGHTRWATHGTPTLENAHPHKSHNSKFCVVHNGIIENYLELKEELQSEGYTFKSSTDTEVIPNLLEKYYRGDIKEAVIKTVCRLKGAFALGILFRDLPETVIGVKNFSPLIVGIGENCNLIASDIYAISENVTETAPLEDGQIVFLTPEKFNVFDFKGKEIKINTQKAEPFAEDDGKMGYSHFMMKEIMEQPKAFKRTLESYVSEGEIALDGVLQTEIIKNLKSIVFVACGSAYHAAFAAKYMFEELLGIPTTAEYASEFRYKSPSINKETLVIAVSQSGETADTLAALKEAKKRGAYTLAIVNVSTSAIAKAADTVLHTKAGIEIAVATTKGYTTQLCMCYLLGIKLALSLDKIGKIQSYELLKELKGIPVKIEEILSNQTKIEAIAKTVKGEKSVFFIGRNMDYASAMEASLKLKEISYIHSESYPSGELKHGTISLIEEGTVVFALCCHENLIEKQFSNIKEVLARGGKIISCVSGEIPIAFKEIGECFSVPKTHPYFTCALEVIPFQLLSYYTALFKNLDIDKPRNLAKSVTVE